MFGQMGVERENLTRPFDLVGDTLPCRLRLRPKLQVAASRRAAAHFMALFQPIVGTFTVFVMDGFARSKNATKAALHHKRVLEQLAPVDDESSVAILRDVPAAVLCTDRGIERSAPVLPVVMKLAEVDVKRGERTARNDARAKRRTSAGVLPDRLMQRAPASHALVVHVAELASSLWPRASGDGANSATRSRGTLRANRSGEGRLAATCLSVVVRPANPFSPSEIWASVDRAFGWRKHCDGTLTHGAAMGRT